MRTRTRKLLATAVVGVPLAVALPTPASAECVNGVNASVMGDATQTNDCTSVVVTPGTPTTPPVATP